MATGLRTRPSAVRTIRTRAHDNSARLFTAILARDVKRAGAWHRPTNILSHTIPRFAP